MIMKVIKVFFVILVVWAIVLFVFFGPGIVYKVANTPEINELKDLHTYKGYTIEKLDSDFFGNWVIIKKESEEVVLKCSNQVFESLSIDQSF